MRSGFLPEEYYIFSMFTGIIEALAPVISRSDSQLTIERPTAFSDIQIGSSICTAGACLSVIKFDDTSITFDVVPETWERTTLGKLKEGDPVNLERALPAGGRFEGHVVQGHVEGSATVLNSPSPHPSPSGGGEPKRNKPLPRNVKFYAREMRQEPTEVEEMLWEHLRRHGCGIHFRRQHPIGGCILDFYCHEGYLGVEIDGSVHEKKEQKAYDKERQQYLESEHGIHILRFTNDQVMSSADTVLKTIQEHLNSPPSSREGLGEGAKETKTTQETGGMLVISLPRNLAKFVIPKGSIAIDGVSLTVASIDGNECTIALIPHTCESTTLGSLQAGDHVNIETDVIVRSMASLIPQK